MLTTERLKEGAAEISKNWFDSPKLNELKAEDLQRRIVGTFDKAVSMTQDEFKRLQDQAKSAKDERDQAVQACHELKQRVEGLEEFLGSVQNALSSVRSA